ncbi:hypothetical protein MKZ38_000712 [Zalerion maritima]|uniref:Uncharacterized protein n=1 Tax=Zalerion maritima TaxID=339359 RepID=A0AAD5WSD6_9PEZI|nr:hypothetical protein MKZ38_000712 [Zalerion maritima]
MSDSTFANDVQNWLFFFRPSVIEKMPCLPTGTPLASENRNPEIAKEDRVHITNQPPLPTPDIFLVWY